MLLIELNKNMMSFKTKSLFSHVNYEDLQGKKAFQKIIQERTMLAKFQNGQRPIAMSLIKSLNFKILQS